MTIGNAYFAAVWVQTVAAFTNSLASWGRLDRPQDDYVNS